MKHPRKGPSLIMCSKLAALVVAASFALAACSESRELPDVVVRAQDASVGSDAPVDEGPAGADAATRRDERTTNPPGAGVVINEVNAQGDDWIELYNAGASSVDLSNHAIADSDDMGAPRADRALRLPAGTMLAPRTYLFVRADVADATEGPQTACAPGPSPCFHIDWGISASNGETVFLLDGDDRVLDRAVYAANAAPEGRSLGRVPDGTGALVAAQPTPGAANRAE